VDDGWLEIDNNSCENAIRPTAVGKKNFLFVGHPQAGQRSAVIYSVLGSCRRRGINPAEYLHDVFERLPKGEDLRSKISHARSLGQGEAQRGAPVSLTHSRRKLSFHGPWHFPERLQWKGVAPT
jgi:hypothetical protein